MRSKPPSPSSRRDAPYFIKIRKDQYRGNGMGVWGRKHIFHTALVSVRRPVWRSSRRRAGVCGACVPRRGVGSGLDSFVCFKFVDKEINVNS